MSNVVKKNEFGNAIYIDAAYDLSGATLSLQVTLPSGGDAGWVAAPEMQTADTNLPDGTVLQANLHAKYVVADGDLPEDGDYRVKLTAQWGSTKRLKSFYRILTVAP